MENSQQKINWFPGHMKKATDQIGQILKSVDVVIEVVDARGVNLTSNHELETLIGSKPLLQVALKSDLVDIKTFTNKPNLVYASKYDMNLVKVIIKKLEAITASKTAKNKAKGLLVSNYQVMIIGLPNVGKTSLINTLIKKSHLRVENRPGVTKKISQVKLNDRFNLLDTPGILFKKIDEFNVGAKLVLMGIIKPEVVPLNEVMLFGYRYLTKHYLALITKFYQFEIDENYEFFLERLASKRKFLLKGNQLDYDRAQQTFFSDLTSGKIGKINFEYEI
ncbi:ribosome biogenesis GTPase YlqF [[Mycoplasma] testudinis]|uniref:ribosome biogenesis GTPase YlqF n=1 Tax=[Mycoplasma] testudinis TaxID=33924 RepID=UPI000482FAAD|nr:ribosome biogenesis GTPase YlqF [[Mycoplasma] testudinis]